MSFRRLSPAAAPGVSMRREGVAEASVP